MVRAEVSQLSHARSFSKILGWEGILKVISFLSSAACGSILGDSNVRALDFLWKSICISLENTWLLSLLQVVETGQRYQLPVLWDVLTIVLMKCYHPVLFSSDVQNTSCKISFIFTCPWEEMGRECHCGGQ